jgi:hypothetical protein
MHEMPIWRTPLMGAMRWLAAIPKMTVTVSVAKVAIATPLFDFHDRCVVANNAKWVACCSHRRCRWNRAQQRKYHQPARQKPYHGITLSVIDYALTTPVVTRLFE